MASEDKGVPERTRISYALLQQLPSKHPHALVALILFGTALGIYVSTLPTSITWRNFGADSGELATAVHTFGVAHPPGYPTYILIGKLFSLLPFDEVAYRTNIMSAFFASAAVVLVYFIVIELIRLIASGDKSPSRPISIASAGIAAFTLAASPLFWSQATITEVYALNAFFVAAVVLLLVLRANRGSAAPEGPFSDRYLIAAAFLLGLGLGNHTTLLILVPPAIALISLKWSKRNLITLPSTLGVFLVGLAIYVYLPVTATGDPFVNWGRANEFNGFWWTISGKIYWQFAFSTPRAVWLDKLGDSWSILVDQFNYPGVVIGLAGVALLWRRNFWASIFTILFLLLVLLYSTTYATSDSQVFLIPAGMVYTLWIGLGAFWVLSVGLPRFWRQKRLIPHQRHLRPALLLASALMVGLVPVWALAFNYSDQDLSGDTEAAQYGRQVLQTVEPGSLIILELDPHIFSLWYTAFVSDPGADVILVTQNLLPYDWYVDNLRKQYPDILPEVVRPEYKTRLRTLVKANIDERAIYITDRTGANDFLFGEVETERVAIADLGGKTLYRVQPSSAGFSE